MRVKLLAVPVLLALVPGVASAHTVVTSQTFHPAAQVQSLVPDLRDLFGKTGDLHSSIGQSSIGLQNLGFSAASAYQLQSILSSLKTSLLALRQTLTNNALSHSAGGTSTSPPKGTTTVVFQETNSGNGTSSSTTTTTTTTTPFETAASDTPPGGAVLPTLSDTPPATAGDGATTLAAATIDDAPLHMPEPATWSLMIMAFAGLALGRRRWALAGFLKRA